MRCFLGIPLPPGVQRALYHGWAGLRDALNGRGCRWVPAENLHLTLRFLGEADRGRLKSVTRCAGSVIESMEAPRLRLGQPGVFPARGPRPLVVWVGLEGDLGLLEGLARRLEGCAQESGYRPEKRSFRPHVTLARLKGLAARELQAHLLPSVAVDEWVPEGVHLLESVQGRNGRREYPTLESWGFSRPASTPTLPE